jgi:hypothetical protein
MKAAQWFNAVTLALAASFALTLAAVCVMYAANLDAGPRVREEWSTVLGVTAVFTALGALAGLAFVAQRRLWPRREHAQLLLYVGVAAAAWLLYRILL